VLTDLRSNYDDNKRKQKGKKKKREEKQLRADTAALLRSSREHCFNLPESRSRSQRLTARNESHGFFLATTETKLAPAFIFSTLTPPRRDQQDRDGFFDRTIPQEAPLMSAFLKKQNKKKIKERKNADASLCRC
jgi:hypothetical protein